MARKRPSGLGGNSRQFARIEQPDGQELFVPKVRGAGTFLYLADENGEWPSTWTSVILDPAYELQEGTLFEVEKGDPARNPGEPGVGTIIGAKVVKAQVRVTINVDKRYGKYGLLKRLVYAVPVPNYEELAELSGEPEEES